MNAGGESSMMRIETANSVWMFDMDRMRFWRVPRGLDVNSFATARAWQPFFELEIDSETGAFSVWLDEAGSRRLRSYQLAPAHDVTRELRLDPVD